MISFEKAKELVIQNIKPVDLCKLALSESRGAVLADDVYAPRNIPLRRNSAMDGFAFKLGEFNESEDISRFEFQIIDEIPGKGKDVKSLKKVQCHKVFTGSPLPDHIDTVIPKEDILISGSLVNIKIKPKVGKNIRAAGEDLKRGELALCKGTVLGPAEIGLLASCGKMTIDAYKRPKIAVLPTGDEICKIDDPEAFDKTIDSNSHIISSLLSDLNIDAMILPICKDSREEILSALEILNDCDGLITTAGISVGEDDLVLESLQKFGAKLIFSKVAIKPARPTTFLLYGSKPVFCLPGNPVAAMVAFMEIFTPGLKKLMGYRDFEHEYLSAVLESPLKSTDERTHFIRAVAKVKDGFIHAESLPFQGSGILKSMARANAIIVQPPNSPAMHAGDRVMVHLF